MSAVPSGPRCAAWARDVELDPAGTAPRCDTFVLVEHPLPWPADLGDDPQLAAIEDSARRAAGPGRAVRLQLLAADGNGPIRRVVVFAAGDPPFTGYGRLEASGAPEQLPDLVASMLAAEVPAPDPCVTDVLVCTHGTRDTCCGSMGTRLWLEVADQLHGTRVWRTSHTGGHRFAPTAITFPDGNYWAFLDASTLDGIVTRQLPAADAAAHLRGCAFFSPAAQVADRAVLAARGWDWLGCARFGEERNTNRVELCFETVDGERGGYVACLTDGRRMPVPECGRDPDTATKSQVEVRVAHMEAWP